MIRWKQFVRDNKQFRIEENVNQIGQDISQWDLDVGHVQGRFALCSTAYINRQVQIGLLKVEMERLQKEKDDATKKLNGTAEGQMAHKAASFADLTNELYSLQLLAYQREIKFIAGSSQQQILDLSLLVQEGELLEDLSKLEPFELTLRWMNLVCARYVKSRKELGLAYAPAFNFGSDLQDSSRLATLIAAVGAGLLDEADRGLNSRDKNDLLAINLRARRCSLEYIDPAAQLGGFKDVNSRAKQIIEELGRAHESIDSKSSILQAEHILQCDSDLLFIEISQLFLRCPTLPTIEPLDAHAILDRLKNTEIKLSELYGESKEIAALYDKDEYQHFNRKSESFFRVMRHTFDDFKILFHERNSVHSIWMDIKDKIKLAVADISRNRARGCKTTNVPDLKMERQYGDFTKLRYSKISSLLEEEDYDIATQSLQELFVRMFAVNCHIFQSFSMHESMSWEEFSLFITKSGTPLIERPVGHLKEQVRKIVFHENTDGSILQEKGLSTLDFCEVFMKYPNPNPNPYTHPTNTHRDPNSNPNPNPDLDPNPNPYFYSNPNPNPNPGPDPDPDPDPDPNFYFKLLPLPLPLP